MLGFWTRTATICRRREQWKDGWDDTIREIWYEPLKIRNINAETKKLITELQLAGFEIVWNSWGKDLRHVGIVRYSRSERHDPSLISKPRPPRTIIGVMIPGTFHEAKGKLEQWLKREITVERIITLHENPPKDKDYSCMQYDHDSEERAR